MGHCLKLTALLAVSGILLSSASAEPREKPKALEVLGRYVGDWTSDVTSKPAVWTPKEIKYRTSNHAEFVLDGWFLNHIEVNHVVGDPEKVAKALMVWTYDYDPNSPKFVEWFFHSSGVMGKWTGTWNPKDKVLMATAVDPPPNTTARFTEAFPNDSTINGTLVFTGNDGKTMFDMVWTRKRQAGIGGKPTRKQWSELGKPIEPLPKELKKLEPFIGEWDSEFILRPTVVSSHELKHTGRMAAQWILDGRFLLGTSEVENHKSMWIIGYDTNRRAFRYLRFTNAGEMDESIGQWNEETRSFVWKTTKKKPFGITKTSTIRFVGKDAVHSHFVAEDSDGRVHTDLTIRSTRRK